MIFINHMEVLSGEAAIVEIEGHLNGKTSPDFEEYINQLLEKEMIYILIDASKLEFVSSEGIGVMLYIQKKITERNGFFILYNLTSEVSSLYDILGFSKVFNIAHSKIEALQIMDRQREMREKGEDKGEDSGNFAVSLEKDEDITISEFQGTLSGKETAPDKELKTVQKKKEAVSATFSPFIVECEKCKTLIRIKKSGSYLCPTCKTELTVNNDQTVDFI